MELAAYAIEAEVEETHWWFVGRRRLFAAILRDLRVPVTAEILDIGTSTGTNLRLLKDLGFRKVRGLDNNEAAIAFCAAKQFGTVELGDACALPFPAASIDLVLATDIIEHVDEDDRALAEICRVLRPGGFALITVPAFSSLWGLQDRRAFHKRRYRMADLIERVLFSGLTIERRFYFNYVLFVPIWLARRVMGLLRINLSSEGQVNTVLINRVLTAVFDFDVRTAPYIRPPFGVSILVVAEKPIP